MKLASYVTDATTPRDAGRGGVLLGNDIFDLETLIRWAAHINGGMLSTDNTKNIYYGFPQLVEQASLHARLRPGDVIGSGTCGTGCILELGTERHRWLQPGDTVELAIERLGLLRNSITAPQKQEK